MKNVLAVLFALFVVCSGWAQTNTSFVINSPLLDKSPMDMAYYPANYPMLKSQQKPTEPLVVRVIYSRPQKNNRVIFGDLVEYGKVWRLGANEATEIEFFRDVFISNKKITRGRYTLYAIPTPEFWTLIINRDTDTWGAFVYDQKKDVVRVDEPVINVDRSMEAFTMSFEKVSAGISLVMEWDNVKVILPISYAPTLQ